MYLQFHSGKEPSKNHDICVRVMFGSWQNLSSGLVRCCLVRALSHLVPSTVVAASTGSSDVRIYDFSVFGVVTSSVSTWLKKYNAVGEAVHR